MLTKNPGNMEMTKHISNVVNLVTLRRIVTSKEVQTQGHNLNLLRTSQLLTSLLPTKQSGKADGPLRRLTSKLLLLRIKKISLIHKMKTSPMPTLILTLMNYQKTDHEPINSTPSGFIE
jgi:hypothetical protein